MPGDFKLRPWPIFLLSFVGFSLFFFNLIILTGVDVKGKISKIKLGSPKKAFPYFDPPAPINEDSDLPDEIDQHPIVELTRFQLKAFEKHKRGQSKNFAQTVQKYRRKYGRHPPPGFDKWYTFAMKRKVINIDDFDQVMDDLRPFYGIKPAEIRAMVRAMDNEESKVTIFKIRNNKVGPPIRPDSSKAEVFERILKVVAPYLPDLDIAMNILDEPRVLASWEDVQTILASEKKQRSQHAEATNEFSKVDWEPESPNKMDLGFFKHTGKMYMDIAAKGCPPESYARRPELDIKIVENSYKDPIAGFIRNFNLSTDVCTVGPTISQMHSFLFNSGSTIATHKLIPIFSENKINVNNDILIPFNKYYDEKYADDDDNDIPWHEKKDMAVWRGPTIGGQNEETYHKLHRHRFVSLTNNTQLGENFKATIMAALDEDNSGGEYTQGSFRPFQYAELSADVAFSKVQSCVPDCRFLATKVTPKPELDLKDTFKFKYLPDLDSHTASTSWYAFLKSKCMGIKSTIFREWHDQRLFEWTHFVPMDNRYDDWYAIMTYFTGLNKETEGADGNYVPRHDLEAERIASRSKEWASSVLRKEDIEVYVYRLLLEYARVVDDNRDRIGYSADGTEVDAAKDGWGWGP